MIEIVCWELTAPFHAVNLHRCQTRDRLTLFFLFVSTYSRLTLCYVWFSIYYAAHLQFTFSCRSLMKKKGFSLILKTRERIIVYLWFLSLSHSVFQFGMCRLAVTMNSVICFSTFSCHNLHTDIRVCQITWYVAWL
jgi:hypothetical protein